MIIVTVFLSILNQMKFHLVQNRMENCFLSVEMQAIADRFQYRKVIYHYTNIAKLSYMYTELKTQHSNHNSAIHDHKMMLMTSLL